MSYQITRIVKRTKRRKIIQGNNYRINLPIDWVRLLNLKKGDFLKLTLNDTGFLAEIDTEQNALKTPEEDHHE